MANFLAERYQPEPSTREAITAMIERERAVALAMSIRHVGTVYIPADETCFTLFEAPSRELVIETSERFALGYSRVELVILVSSPVPDGKP